jgi:hypothetical protein
MQCDDLHSKMSVKGPGILLGLLGIIFVQSCNTSPEGSLLSNQAPETHTTVDTIIRSGDDRLESRVEISWWADDPDGYVVSYEYSFDNPITSSTIWETTIAQDSIFVLQTPAGLDSADFLFSVRAIDNEGLVDPTPAQATYPVKNSAPTAAFTEAELPRLSFPVLRLFWSGDDPDGSDNLEAFNLFWNDTSAPAYRVDATVENAIFEAIDPFNSGAVDCRVFLNNSSDAEASLISGMQLDAWNVLYIQSIDESDARSAFIASDSVYIKRVRSSTLLVNAYSGSGEGVLDFYAERMINQGITEFDSSSIFDDDFPAQLAADNLTQGKVFDLFDLIIWFGNNAESSLSLAQKTTGDFFNSGGKMFMSVYVSSSFDEQSDFLDFTPIAELIDPVDSTILLEFDAEISASESAWPDLSSTSIVGVVRPMRLQPGAEALYEAALSAREDAVPGILFPWPGNSIVMGRKRDAFGDPNFIMSTLEVHKLDGNSNMDLLFDQIITEDFGF